MKKFITWPSLALGAAILLITTIVRLSVTALTLIGGFFAFWPDGKDRMKAYAKSVALSEDEGLNASLRGSRRVTFSATCGWHLRQAEIAKREGRQIPNVGMYWVARLTSPIADVLLFERDHYMKASVNTRHLGVGATLGSI